ncbi:hypothetical protein [Nitrosopumilus sp. S4]
MENYNKIGYDEIDFEYMAMAELTKEIGSLVENSINQCRDELNPQEIEHVIKMTSDVISKLKGRSVKLTV